MNVKLMQALDEVFGPHGWLVNRGGHHLPEQLAYAKSIAAWLGGDSAEPLALIEGETGTGKTLGYLFPLVLNWAFTGEKAVIATHTISLQNQLLAEDFKLVEAYLLEHSLPLPRVQQRLGKQHYIDPNRVEVVADMEPDHAERSAFLEWACESAVHGTGLISSWLEEYGPLPEGVEESSVCLTSWSHQGSNPAYERDKERTAEADLIVTSHMMVMLEAKEYQSILGLEENKVRHLLFDEGDQVPPVAETLSTYRRQIQEPIRSLRSLIGHGSSRLDSVIKTAIHELSDSEQWLREYGRQSGGVEVVLDREDGQAIPDNLASVISGIQGICSKVAKSIKKSQLGREQAHPSVLETVELLEGLANFDREQNGLERIHALSWSPKLLIPSLMAQRANPAFYVSNLWRNMGLRVAFTSATLGASVDQSAGSLSPFMAQLAISPGKVCVLDQIAPAEFGSVKYVLADSTVPNPFSRLIPEDHGEKHYSATWLSYATRMIERACGSGPTLVLTGSYLEATKLGKQLSSYRPLVHTYGKPLAESIEAFRDGQSQVLITPAAWQGISIRNRDGSQLMRNLVITRIPFQPRNETAERLAAVLAERAGRHTPSAAKGHIRVAQLNRVMVKLRQGFGRVIRKKGDEATIWICDPRFPKPGEKTIHKRFVGVIPERFMSSYQDAVVFSAEGVDRKARQEAPRIVEEVLNL